ncbi:MAG TPA: hypothetical protein VGL24_13730 [Chthoniobacterales bacterium]
METQYSPPPPRSYHGFWPVLLIGLSVLFIFAWEVRINILTRQSTQQLEQQQVTLVDQASKVQIGLEKLVRGLVELGKTDEEAQKLVTKFGIKLNNPTMPTTTPAP